MLFARNFLGGAGILTGPYSVPITVVDDATGLAIEGARVRMYRTGYTQTQPTDVTGGCTFNVGGFTWSIIVIANGYEGGAGVIVVPGELTKEIRLTAVDLAASVNPAECAVTFEIRDQGNRLIEGAKVYPSLGTSPAGVSGATLINTQKKGVTEANGRCTITLVRSSEITNGTGVYGVRVDYLGQCYQFALTAPDSPSFLATMDI